VSLEFVADKKLFAIKKATWEYIPDYLISKAAELPVIGTPGLKK